MLVLERRGMGSTLSFWYVVGCVDVGMYVVVVTNRHEAADVEAAVATVEAVSEYVRLRRLFAVFDGVSGTVGAG